MMNRREFLKLLGTSLLFPLVLEARGAEGVREAENWEKLEGKKVRCLNCPHHCVLSPGERGFCRVRENRNGKLYTLVYGNPCAVHIDPIEKKPLFHFLPGTTALSIATAGCNFRCKYCQNWRISQYPPEETENYEFSPRDVVNLTLSRMVPYDCYTIAYTYTEPSVFYEYMYDTCVLAEEYGIKNIYHSNGFLEEKPLRKLTKVLHGANIDLKFFTDELYRKISSVRLEPALRTLKILKEEGVHLEITNLVVPTLNDKDDMIKKMCGWIIENLGDEVPVHFSRFFPTHRLRNLPPTPLETVEHAREIAKKEGLKFVYLGNVPAGHEGENTYCPGCGKLLIRRLRYLVTENHIKNGKCPYCGEKIYGVWER